MDLKMLKTLSTLKYQHSEQAISGLLRRESELRSELERMSELARTTLVKDPEHSKMHAIGADVIWLKWVGKVQRELNISLARVLAQKETLMAQHRRANGRKTVAEALADRQEIKARETKSARQIQSAIDYSVSSRSDQ